MINDSVKEELRQRLIEYVSQITTPSRKAGKNMFVCPLCGSGSHGGRDSDGAFHLTGDRWYCHSCQKGGDIFTLYAEINQLDTVSDFPEINKGLAQALGVTQIDSARRDFTPERREVRQEVKQINPERMTQIESFASQLAGSPAETYLRERGFSDEIIKKYRLGYDQAKNAVVIPYPGTDYFTKRLIAPAEGQNKYDNLPGEAPTFMIRESTSDYYFVTEGQLDALSMIQAGAKNVIASHYPSKIEKLIDDGLKIDGAVIVADHDEPGEKIAKQLTELFSEKKVKSLVIYPPEGFKDSNDVLRADQKQLTKLVSQWAKELLEKPEEGLKVINVGEYLTESFFEKDIEYFKRYKDRKIRFENIDRHVTLYPGVACLGGPSSLGKTTFAVNAVDNLLRSGESVIYFALEQLPIELITKSLARRVYEIEPFSPIDNRDIKNGASSDTLARVKNEYAQMARQYRIIEGNFHFTAKDIADYVEGYIRKTGIRPVVVIDYLQLIAPPVGLKGASQREITDENLKTIKDLSKRNELFILLVSSFNRASYNVPVSMESFKESGMIEYTCDYIFALQLALLDDPDFLRETDKGKREQMIYEAVTQPIKDVAFVCLKNRNGRQRFKCFFRYNMRFDKFAVENNSKYDLETAYRKPTRKMI